MSAEKDFTQGTKKTGFLRILGYLLIFGMLILLGIFGILHIPSVQTWLTGQLTEYLQKETGFPVEIGQTSISWFDALNLQDIKVYDQQDSLMIHVQEAYVDFSLSDLIDTETPGLDEVTLRSPDVRLYKHAADSGLNIDQFIKNLRNLFIKPSEGPKQYVPFFIDDVNIANGRFTYHDPYKDSLAGMFDPNHFQLEGMQVEAEAFRVLADTIDLNIAFLSAQAPEYDFIVDTLITDFRYYEQGMDFNGLQINTGKSRITDSLSLRYNSPATLSYFIDSVAIGAHFENTIISTNDLAVFAPYFQQVEDTYRISGNFQGTVSNFRARNLDARFGDNTRIEGRLHMDGLPDFKETFIDADFRNSRLHPEDLKPYIKETNFNTLERIGTLSFTSSFIGFPNDFVAQGRFITRLGVVDTDLNLKLTERSEASTYSGSLSLDNFDLGKFLDNPKIGKIGLTSEVRGKGLTFASAQLELEAEAAFFGFNEYQYQNIIAEGNLSRQFFAGQLSVKDPNLQFSGEASIDLRNDRNSFIIDAVLDTANLQALNITEKPLSLHSQIDINLRGLNLDSLQGEAYFGNVALQYEGRSLIFDTLHLHSSTTGKERSLQLTSNLFDFSAEGNFSFSQIGRDFNRLIKEYQLNFRNQSEEIRAYYASKPDLSPEEYDKYTIDFTLALENPDPIVKLVIPELHLSNQLLLEGRFSGGYTSIVSAYTQADTVQIGSNFFYNVGVDLNSSKIADSTDVLAMAFVQSDQQEISGIAPTKSLVFEGIWAKDHIDLSGEIYQQEKNNYLDLVADIYFLQDTTLFQFAPSILRVLDNSWQFSRNNRLYITKEALEFRDFKLFHKDQVFLAEGILSDNGQQVLHLQLDSVALDNLNPISPYDLDGKVQGRVDIRKKQDTYIVSGDVDILDMLLGGFPVGNVSSSLAWRPAEEQIFIDLSTELAGKTVMTARGTYAPFEVNNQLGLDAVFNETKLNLLEPVLGEYFSDLNGLISGQAVITGKPSAPIIRGGGAIKQGAIKINYTGVRYTYNGNFVLLENEIGFRNLALRDSEGNSAYLNGGIFHDGFKNFVIDLQASLQGAKVLNTTFKENSLYYGVAYASGSLDILGPVNNLLFTAEARTDKGTKIYIPIEEDNSISSKEFIHFVSRKDSSQVNLGAQLGKRLNLSGIKLDFDLEVTPDAYVEVIFDLRAGDIIRGRGQGKLEMDIDTRGEFTMFGNYEITEGAYNFTLFNVITKEFIIDPGSTIRWNGDPYGAQMNIQASYIQYASLKPLLNTVVDDPLTNRAYPIVLSMDLTGALLSPDIDFDIVFKDFPQNFYNELQSFRQNLRNNEQLLNRQVFNLIVLRQFIPDEQYNPTGVGALGSRTAISSISELLTNQFSMLASQINENLEIDFDVSSTVAAEAINTFQLRLSYTFLNGRLRVTSDGSLVTQSTTSSNSNLVGNWTVEYLLTPDGQYRVKMYSRNNQSQIRADFKPETQQGVSFEQSKSFDNLRELFERNRPERPASPLPNTQPDSDVGSLLKEEEEN